MCSSRVVIFTDEPGWHGRVLHDCFGRAGFEATFVSLTACDLNLSDGVHGLLIPGFEKQLPAAAFVRGVPGGSLEQIVLRLNFLHHLEALGCVVFNSGRAIERTVDKGMTSLLLRQRGVLTPQTFVSEDPGRTARYVKSALNAGRQLVKKPLFGSQGNGLQRVRSPADAAAVSPQEVFYLQDFVPPGGGVFRDYRVMVVHGQAVAAMSRSSEHWVTNRAQGAVCEAVNLSDDMVVAAVQATAAIDIDYAGVDLLRDAQGRWLVIEVNGIPAWQGLQRATGIDITAALCQAVLDRMACALAKPA